MKSSRLTIAVSILAILSVGCTETSLFDAHSGKRIVRIQADASNVSYTGNGVSFHADTLNHSAPTLAGGRAFSNGVSSVGVAAVGIGSTLLPAGAGIAPLLTRTAAVALPTTVAASRSK